MRKFLFRSCLNRTASGFRPKVEILDERLQPGNAMWNPPLDPLALLAPTLATLDQAAAAAQYIQLQAQSDATGTYDRNTGEATLQIAMNLVIYSPNAPGFDNSGACAVPATQLAFDTNNPGGSLFLNGDGTVVDDTFVMDQLPHGACGTIMGNHDYADMLNPQLGLPSLNSGDNSLTLHLHMRPAIGPFS
jgi:hypothetical protein